MPTMSMHFFLEFLYLQICVFAWHMNVPAMQTVAFWNKNTDKHYFTASVFIKM